MDASCVCSGRRAVAFFAARMFQPKLTAGSRELASGPIARALAVSLMLHFTLIAGLELGRSAGFWNARGLPRSSQSELIRTVMEESKKREELRQQMERAQQVPEAEMVFMDVDPSQAVDEPPPDETRFYSAQNTVAANPDPQVDLTLPKIDGTQERVPKAVDTLRPDPRAMQPASAPEEKTEPEEEQPAKTQPRIAERPPQDEQPELKAEGEMLVARAAPREQEAKDYVPPAEPARPRPRTLAEARAQKGILEGPKMKQEGGVRRLALASSMNVRATPFGAYDAAFIAAVQARWFNLLDERTFAGSQSGKVVVEFNLNRDGRITEMRVVESEVSETLSWVCQRAILDPAPYRPFPPDLRRMLQRDFRPVRFTFYYNQ
jgi:outer membrane biosynthesis protein TonB